MIETIVLTIVNCVLNLACFLSGVVVTQKIFKNKEININPIKSIAEAQKTKQIEKEADLKRRKIETSLYNLDHYDGTGLGQKPIPKE